jgi:hypothetical protein
MGSFHHWLKEKSMDFMQNPHLTHLSASDRERAIQQAIRSRRNALKLSVWGSLALVAVMLVTILAEKIH